MKKCSFCAGEFQDEVEKCKYCNCVLPETLEVKKEKKSRLPKLVLYLIISFLVLIAVVGDKSPETNTNAENKLSPKVNTTNITTGNKVSSEDSKAGINIAGASVQAQEFVKKALKSPSTAKFPGLWEVDNNGVVGYEKATKRYEVVSYVDSENSYGAMIRSNWQVILKDLGTGEWQLESMVIDGKIVYSK